MEKRRLGNSDIFISPILLGTWQAGKRMWTGIEDQESIAAIRTGVDLGINTIDTAEIYGDGYSEKIIAQAVGDRRSEVIYASKVFANHLQYEQVLEACDRSLVNLQTDYIDLYQIHWPAGSFNSEIVPIEETMAALNHLQAQGKIRAIGVSNFARVQLEEAMQYGRIESLQPPYSLFWRFVETDALGYCQEHNISILAYSPLAQGLLTGKISPEHRFEEGDHRSKNKLLQGENFVRVQHALKQMRPIAAAYNCSLAQLALAWLIAQPQTQAIAGVRNPSQVQDNAQALYLKLTPDTLQALDTISRQVTDYLEYSPLMWNF
jgi:aryl-alcohol dehydrogenase-like predicted oxidoreductase